MVQKAWRDWHSHRRESGKPLTTASAHAQISILEDMGSLVGGQVLRRAISNGWTGIEASDAQKVQRADDNGDNWGGPGSDAWSRRKMEEQRRRAIEYASFPSQEERDRLEREATKADRKARGLPPLEDEE